MLTERTTTLFVSIFYFQKCQTRDLNNFITFLLICQPIISAIPIEIFPKISVLKTVRPF